MLTDAEYEEIGKRVRRAALGHFIQEADIQDIIQNIALDVLTNQVPPDEYKTVISRHLGKFRQKRKREGDRLTPFSEE